MRNVDELRDPAYLKRIISRSVTVTTTFELKHSPAELWPFISNTDMVNKRMGLPAVTYSFRKNAAGGTFVHGKFRAGPLMLDYEELPFEWLAPRFLRSDRVFQNGPLRLMRYEVELSPLPAGGTGVLVALTISPSSIGILGKPIIRSFLSRFERVYRDIDSRLEQKRVVIPAVGFLEDGESVRKRARALAEDWEGLMPRSPIPLICGRVHLQRSGQISPADSSVRVGRPALGKPPGNAQVFSCSHAKGVPEHELGHPLPVVWRRQSQVSVS